ncbi:MAG: pyruvate, phosphate dikinase [Candidatus Eisenbacteria bacterium]|nr:pyruvate, phosphate dikinase [Candidatus Eisenbacteria bacterium]
MSQQSIYFFGEGTADGDGSMKDLLGGKGAGLAEMSRAGVPVPPGFTIVTRICNEYYANGMKVGDDFQAGQDAALERLERVMGKKLGDADDPLLVSVRSGAKFSMPGMMDTILNLGLNDRSVEGLSRRTSNPRFAWDCYRRFVQMFSSVVFDMNKSEFEHVIGALKKKRRIQLDTDFTVDDLKQLVQEFKALVQKRRGGQFPQDPRDQLNRARNAVFRSWNGERAVYYRRKERISDDLGTAVNVQAMVFGNLGVTSATGVGFTRNPSTGENVFYGEYLINAQGEDVVAGVRTPEPISVAGKNPKKPGQKALEETLPEAYRQLVEITRRLEKHYRDIQDFEFTIQENKLFMLQTRTGKRTGAAAVKIAVDMVKEGLISDEEAVLRVEPEQLNQLLHRQFDPKASLDPIAQGLAASPGAAVGEAVFTAEAAVERAGAGHKVILVRNETVPDDIHGMDVSQGILTATGGMTSHAAVVARGMGKCCVVGCGALDVDEKGRCFKVGKVLVKEGEFISLNGNTGQVILGAAKTVDPELTGEFALFMEIVNKIRRLKVRANADVPRDAQTARRFGAEGIGLCRTEHMFFDSDRLPWVVQMILAAPKTKELEYQVLNLQREIEKSEGPRAASLKRDMLALKKELAAPRKQYDEALAKLLPFQRKDFLGLFKAMGDYPVTIRTLDPPLHEFLPKREELLAGDAAAVAFASVNLKPAVVKARLLKEFAALKAKAKKKALPAAGVARLRVLERALELLGKAGESAKLLRRVEELHEFNPMLGHRGCRLGLTYPEITAMQARAIFEAACQVAKDGRKIVPEVMIPLVSTVEEFRMQKQVVDRVAAEVMKKTGFQVPYLVGTMIEIPRAALTAGQIAAEAQFFSFGTNDLTQMTFGFSRDDAGKFLPFYVREKILPGDPFESLDQVGVGRLVKMAVEEGRAARRDLKVGICGEHGGDPESVIFCHKTGLDYVSCSPYRVPLALLAAAHAVLRGKSVARSDQR